MTTEGGFELCHGLGKIGTDGWGLPRQYSAGWWLTAGGPEVSQGCPPLGPVRPDAEQKYDGGDDNCQPHLRPGHVAEAGIECQQY